MANTRFDGPMTTTPNGPPGQNIPVSPGDVQSVVAWIKDHLDLKARYDELMWSDLEQMEPVEVAQHFLLIDKVQLAIDSVMDKLAGDGIEIVDTKAVGVEQYLSAVHRAKELEAEVVTLRATVDAVRTDLVNTVQGVTKERDSNRGRLAYIAKLESDIRDREQVNRLQADRIAELEAEREWAIGPMDNPYYFDALAFVDSEIKDAESNPFHTAESYGIPRVLKIRVTSLWHMLWIACVLNQRKRKAREWLDTGRDGAVKLDALQLFSACETLRANRMLFAHFAH